MQWRYDEATGNTQNLVAFGVGDDGPARFACDERRTSAKQIV
jgi:hypothetical protein